MLGIVELSIQADRISYELTFTHLISVIVGDSGTGKSVLIDTLAHPDSAVISLSGVRNYAVLAQGVSMHVNEAQMQELFDNGGGIVFADEYVACARYHEFYELLQKYNLRAVICLRDLRPMGYLSFSWAALYKLRYDSENNTNKLTPYFSESLAFSRYMGLREVPFTPERVCVEDSGYGLQFYRYVFGKDCSSAMGKGNFKAVITSSKAHEKLLLIADGADIGSELYKLKSKLDEAEHDNVVVWQPECTEWLILLLPKFYKDTVSLAGDDNQVLAVLKAPYMFVDTNMWYSYEQFYTDILRQVLRTHGVTTDLKSNGAIPEHLVSKEDVRRLFSWLDGLDLSQYGIAARHIPPQPLTET